MKVLPAETPLPSDAIVRRHAPGGRYSSFRSCARWDFGFTCPLCLLHESDLSRIGVEGWGVMTIEHVTTRSSSPSLEDRYDNTLYACRRCNGARGAAARSTPVARLLDPTACAWAMHFSRHDDRIEPHADDADAAYTEATYRLNDSQRVALRAERRERVTCALTALEQLPPRLDRLLDLAASEGESSRRAALIDAADALHRALRGAIRDLRSAAAVPRDASRGCACAAEDARRLPDFVERSCLNLDLGHDEALGR